MYIHDRKDLYSGLKKIMIKIRVSKEANFKLLQEQFRFNMIATNAQL
jgi:hypothetical protein